MVPVAFLGDHVTNHRVIVMIGKKICGTAAHLVSVLVQRVEQIISRIFVTTVLQ